MKGLSSRGITNSSWVCTDLLLRTEANEKRLPKCKSLTRREKAIDNILQARHFREMHQMIILGDNWLLVLSWAWYGDLFRNINWEGYFSSGFPASVNGKYDIHCVYYF